MILILSEQEDSHVSRVVAKLKGRGVEFLWFDPTEFPDRAQMRIAFGQRGVTSRFLAWEGREFDLNMVTAIWCRRPGRPRPAAGMREETHREYSRWTSMHFLQGVWETLDCQWVPAKPAADHFAHNKLVQLSRAYELGFALPQTLITNDPSAFLEFYTACYGRVVSKPLLDTQPKRDGKHVWLYTNVVHRRNVHAYQAIRYAPEIFQKYVCKQSELRVTVVGTRVFAAEIDSQKSRVTRHDWRHYDDDSVEYRSFQLPQVLELRCLNMLAALNLSFGAIDLVLTPE